LRSVRKRLPRIGFGDVFGALLAVFGRFNGHFGAFTMAHSGPGPEYHYVLGGIIAVLVGFWRGFLRSVRSRLPRIGFVDVFGALLAVFGRFNGHFGACTMAHSGPEVRDTVFLGGFWRFWRGFGGVC
jgi:hypothetical protein